MTTFRTYAEIGESTDPRIIVEAWDGLIIENLTATYRLNIIRATKLRDSLSEAIALAASKKEEPAS